jgi:hypothetical protein
VEGFEWAENNLDVGTPHELQARGVNVFFAPSISPDTKVVNLSDGQVERFQADENRPTRGYYADVDDLARVCRQTGQALVETNGLLSTEAAAAQEAGDPLYRGTDGS